MAERFHVRARPPRLAELHRLAAADRSSPGGYFADRYTNAAAIGRRDLGHWAFALWYQCEQFRSKPRKMDPADRAAIVAAIHRLHPLDRPELLLPKVRFVAMPPTVPQLHFATVTDEAAAAVAFCSTYTTIGELLARPRRERQSLQVESLFYVALLIRALLSQSPRHPWRLERWIDSATAAECNAAWNAVDGLGSIRIVGGLRVEVPSNLPNLTAEVA